MGEHLKDFFDAAVVRKIGVSVRDAHPAFPLRGFVRDGTRGLEALELTPRARHISAALRRHLPEDPEQAIGILVRSLGPEVGVDERAGMAPFLYLPHVFFVAEHGLACFEASMRAQHELTRRFSAEFSIRAFLQRHPDRTLERLEAWTRDPSPHVRRLVSEGTRPRLPWAPRLKAFQADPTPVLALLERLKDDPALYVRRSVANNLNDIGKDHPAVLVSVCRRWMKGATAERRWVVERALRSAVKRGDRAALAVLGYGGPARARLLRFEAQPSKPRVGGHVVLCTEVENAGRRPARVVVDVAVHFVKKRGRARPKVFKLRALTLGPKERVVLTKRISLAQHTTRKHHPGRHAVEVLLNGRATPAGAFHLGA